MHVSHFSKLSTNFNIANNSQCLLHHCKETRPAFMPYDGIKYMNEMEREQNYNSWHVITPIQITSSCVPCTEIQIHIDLHNSLPSFKQDPDFSHLRERDATTELKWGTTESDSRTLSSSASQLQNLTTEGFFIDNYSNKMQFINWL